MMSARTTFRAWHARITAAVEKALGRRELCPRCHATLADFDNLCTAPLDVACPGFLLIDDARTAAIKADPWPEGQS